MAAAMAEHPGGSLPARHEGLAELTGAYRWLSNDAIDPAAVVRSHAAVTRSAMAEHAVVLCVQDTTQLDFTGREVQGLGEIGNGHGQGLLQHAALAVSEQGQVLGLLHEQWQAREKPPRGETRRQRQGRTTEADVWEQTARAIGPVQGTRLIHVGDRHADVFGFMRAAVDLGHGFLIRSFHNRLLDDDQGEGRPRLREVLEAQNPYEPRVIHIPARRDRKGRKRKARDAQLSVRWVQTSIPCPVNNPRHDRPIGRAWAVQVREEDPPPGVSEDEVIDWVLWTSEPVTDAASAWQTVERYRCRWVIEEWHKALKQGCRLEVAQLKTAGAIQRLAAVLGVVAVRLMQLRDAADADNADDAASVDAHAAGPGCPGVGPPMPIADPLWRKLVARLAGVAEGEVTARVFFRLIARKGGHLGRKHDPRPGWQCLWTGYRKLALMAQGARAVGCVEG